MQEIRIHGRGGQGAVVASQVLAEAAFLEGKYAQAFPHFGSERRGAPVAAYVRIDDHPIELRHAIYEPDGIIVLDQSLILLGLADVTQGLKKGGFALINSPKHKDEFPMLSDFQVYTIDASKIALAHGLGSSTAPIVNTAILGAFSAITPQVSIESVKKAIEKNAPIKPQENVAAAWEAYQKAKEML